MLYPRPRDGIPSIFFRASLFMVVGEADANWMIDINPSILLMMTKLYVIIILGFCVLEFWIASNAQQQYIALLGFLFCQKKGGRSMDDGEDPKKILNPW